MKLKLVHDNLDLILSVDKINEFEEYRIYRLIIEL